ncbi:Glycosyl transferase, group 2 family protein [human gut metagenome]|uniref:Glycosyl transferase, group 2 family protein n=1 Tax=human gut metagenome TaxID=408170 RepID=W1Y0G8_9ZZZZ
MIEISIIVPIYNVEYYLDKCITSILNQTIKNFEVILVDDGSTDRCGEICDEYKRKDCRIRVIHKDNGGLSSARNFGLNIAIGKYIGFVDSDDYIEKNMFQELLKRGYEDDSDIVICDMKYDLDGEDVNDTNFQDFGVLTGEETLLKYFTNNYFKSHAQNKIYKRELFNDIRFPNNKLFEDVAIFYKLLYRSKKISFVDKKLYIYNQSNVNSITKKVFNLKNFDLLDNSYEMMKFFEEKPCKNQLIKNCNQFYFISANILINMLYKSKKNVSNSDFQSMKNILKKRINKQYYYKGLKIFCSSKKYRFIKYQIYKLSNIFYLYEIKAMLLGLI